MTMARWLPSGMRRGRGARSRSRPVLHVAWLTCVWMSFAAGSVVSAATLDVHELFEARCGSCHAHAGPFARDRFVVVDGILRSRASEKEIRLFLPRHFGRLDPLEAEALHDMFLEQVRSGGLFEQKCRICHVRARDLARDRLVVSNGILTGRYTGNNVYEYLRRHGRLTTEEAMFLTDALAEITRGSR